MAKIQKQTFLEGAMILVLANIIVKVIGAVFKIPLTRILHEEGMAIFTTAYQVYSTLFAISTTGIPTAVSKMVAESMAQNNLALTKRIFKIAFMLLSVLGLVGSVILFFGADAISVLIKDTATAYSIKAISPALFFVCVVSCYRGFFQGMQNMIPTSISQMIEALGKLVFGYLLAIFLVKQTYNVATGAFSYSIASAGAIFGVTLGIVIAFVYLIFRYKNTSKKIYTSENLRKYDSKSNIRNSRILRNLVAIAVPITIGACVSSITAVVDMAMIRTRLQDITFTAESAQQFLNNFGGFTHVFDNITQTLSFTEKSARWLYGSYSGYAVSMFNLPSTIILALSMSIVPAVASALSLKDKALAKKTTESALRLTVLFSLPCAFALAFGAVPILDIVFSNVSSTSTLQILGFASIWVTLVSISTAILQATGNAIIPVRNMLIGGALKVGLNYFLVANPNINILGAPISTNICYMFIAATNLYSVIRITNININIKDFIIKPLLSTLAMTAVIYFGYNIATGIIPNTKIAGILVLCAGALVYVVTLFALKGINRDDIMFLPKGKKILAFLEKTKLIK